MVYFVRSLSGHIKIGTTKCLSERIKHLSSSAGPGLEVLAVTDGSYEEERKLHKAFTHLRIQGEWFHPGQDLIDYINSDVCRSWSLADDELKVAPRIDKYSLGFTGDLFFDFLHRNGWTRKVVTVKKLADHISQFRGKPYHPSKIAQLLNQRFISDRELEPIAQALGVPVSEFRRTEP